MVAVAVCLNEKIESRRSPKRMNGYTDIGKLSESLNYCHGERLDLKLSTYADRAFGLMMFGYSPKDIARMSRSGVRQSDLDRLRLPAVVCEYILSKKPELEKDIDAYFKAIHKWGRNYRRRNKIGGSNVYSFNAAHAQKLREGEAR